MEQIFKLHLAKFIQISEEQFAEILKYFEVKTVSKKEDLQIGNHICKYQYFVLSGLLRMFFITEKGVEQTTEFAIETWWLTDNIAFEKKQATSFYIQAVEKSTVLYITNEKREMLLKAFPQMERYYRFIYQRAYAANQLRVRYLFTMSKEEFYNSIRQTYPAFVQRVPQYLLASYLGFTPEYLSEIRKKYIS